MGVFEYLRIHFRHRASLQAWSQLWISLYSFFFPKKNCLKITGFLNALHSIHELCLTTLSLTCQCVLHVSIRRLKTLAEIGIVIETSGDYHTIHAPPTDHNPPSRNIDPLFGVTGSESINLSKGILMLRLFFFFPSWHIVVTYIDNSAYLVLRSLLPPLAWIRVTTDSFRFGLDNILKYYV